MHIDQLLNTSHEFDFITRDEGKIIAGINSDPSWYRAVRAKLQPSGVKIASNSTRYIQSEILAVKMARILNYTDIQVKELVIALETKRSELANSLLTDLNLLH